MNARSWVVVAACAAVGCQDLEPVDPPLGEVEQALGDCASCGPSSPCTQPCTDEEETLTCAAFECNYDDPCDSDPAIAIEGRRMQLGWSCPSTTLTSFTAVTSGGKYRQCNQGRIAKGPSSCAFGVANGPVLNRYFTGADATTVRSALGYPIAAYSGTLYAQRFEYGYLAPTGSGVAAIVGGRGVPPTERTALMNKWTSYTGTKAPVHDTAVGPGASGWYNTSQPNSSGFDATFTVRAGSTTGHVVHGAIQDLWIAQGGIASSLGWPTSDELCLDGGCDYVYSNFQNGHIRWSGGVATVVAGPIPAVQRAVTATTFRFSLSGPLVRSGQAPDGDGDGLDDDREKQLAFVTAPRIFWDEDESYADNQGPTLRRLDLVQVRPHAGPSGRPVSRWAAGTKEFVKLRFMMEYPRQTTHIGDAELIEVRLSSVDLVNWDLVEIVFTHHGASHYESAANLHSLAVDLQTAYLWIAADEDKHGSWPGLDADQSDCGYLDGIHDCFSGMTEDGHDGTFRDSLAEGDYWWFDATRDLGEPETLRLVAWPPEGRGASGTVPQIRRTANTLDHYVENDTGFGPVPEYIGYRSTFNLSAEKTCGWKCAARDANADCNEAPGPNDVYVCDDGHASFPAVGPHTDVFPAGAGIYPKYGAGDFAYQLWGVAGRAPFNSGNASRTDNALASASSSYAGCSPFTVNDGDRRGVYWGATGGWSDNTPGAPDSLRVFFPPSGKLIREIDVFTLQDTYWAPVEPTPTMTATSYGIRNFLVQYCPISGTCADDGTGWLTVPGGNVVGNNKVWRQFTFAPVLARGIRLYITDAAGGYSRVVELEAWE